MATTAPRRGLSLRPANIPDWTTVQNKTKGTPAPVKPSVTTKPAANVNKPKTKTAARPKPSGVDKQVKPRKEPAVKTTQPEQKEPAKPVLPTAEGQGRKVYSRDFLVKFRNLAPSSFPPGASPADIIAQYNIEYEEKERLALAAQQESASSLSTTPAPVLQPASATPAATGKFYKLRIPKADDTILSRPMFSPARQATPSKAGRAVSAGKKIAPADDKENQSQQLPGRSASAARSVAKPAVKTPKTKAPKETTAAPINVVQQQATPAASESDPTAELTKKLVAILKESDPRRLMQRQKQIDFGKNTNGYSEYVKLVPKSRRRRDDPKTPQKGQVCSKRSWDGQIRKWRRMLHQYDPSEPLPADDDTTESEEVRPAAASATVTL